MAKKLRFLFTLLFVMAAGIGSVSAADTWVKTDIAELQTGDIIVIADQTSSRAMSNDGGTTSAPVAEKITFSDDKSNITSEVATNLQWEVVKQGDSYNFKKIGSDKTLYLYCTNNDNGVRVENTEGASNNITFKYSTNWNFLYNQLTDNSGNNVYRYIGVYNSANTYDWRSYKNTTESNIKDTKIAFYKKVSQTKVSVAKVGTTEYATIEEAVAAWGPGKTLTLLDNVTTTSTVTVEVNATKSTQNWTLDLGDYTWTASGCNAFQLYAAGGTVMNQNYGLKIYANQNGGITASGKYCIECKYDNSTAGYRPRLEIHGGTYNGSNIIYYYSSPWNNSNISNGPSTHIFKSNDGTEPVFNGNFGLYKCPLTIYAGYFNGTSFNTYPVSSTANTNLNGGHFKTISAFPSASNNKGIIFGNNKVFVKSNASIDVVNGAPATYEAKATKTLLLSSNQGVNYSDYVYYEKANDALNKYSSGTIDIILSEGVTATQDKSFRSGTLTIDTSAEGSDYTGNITLTGTSAKFIIKFPEGKGHYGVTTSTGQLHVEETVADGVVTRTYSVKNVSDPEAKVGDTGYSTVYDAFYAIDGTTDNKTIVLQKDVTNAGIVTNGTAVNAAGKTVATFDLNGKSIGIGSVAAGNNADYTLTIIDSSQDKTGTVTNTDASLLILALTGINDYSGTYTLKIQAGTWQFDPSNVTVNGKTMNLVDEGYTARDNGNGTWTVGEVDYVAQIKESGKKYETLQAAFDAATEGQTVTLLKDYDATEAMAAGTRQFVINKSITFDGGGFTLTTKGRGIGVGNVNSDLSNNIGVTIQNVIIKNTSDGARCIDTRGKIGSLTLEGVTLNTNGASGTTQSLTIGGNQSDPATVNITNSTIQTNDAGTAYYAITTFNPVNMTINNSTIKGWANVYAKGVDSSAGSAGSVFALDGCTLVSSNAYSGVSNSFGAFVMEDNNVTINVTNSDINITNTGDQYQAIVCYSKDNTLSGNKVILGEGNKVMFVEPGKFAFVLNQGEGSEFTVSGGIFNAIVPDEFCAEGLTTVDNTNEATKDEYPYAVGVAAVELAQPVIFHDEGTYEGAIKVAIAGEGTIMYKLGEGKAQTYSAPFDVSATTTVTAWTEQDGNKSDEVSKTFTIVEKTAGVEVAEGYYTIKNNGNGKFVNVAGRKTVTFVDEAATATAAGTVIKVKTGENGQVEVLRSQGVDLPGYADKAMRYVPEIVKLVVEKLHAAGSGEILGENGLDSIMKKFNESFDYHLYLENANDNANGYRIYGKTPSMKPVVDFYAENKANVDYKLPKLEAFINSAIEKVLQKTGRHGESILTEFKLHDIWQKMGGTLTEPVEDDAASIAKFYEEVLSSEANVWNFAYQTAMTYWTNVKNHPRYGELKGMLGEYANYIEKVENIQPDFKYYIVGNTSGNGVDFISEGNTDIQNNAARTIWTLEPRADFKVTFDPENVKNGGTEYYATLYTDFGYQLAEGMKAYKVTEVDSKGYAKLEEIGTQIPAQTPVLLMTTDLSKTTLTVKDGGDAVTGNLLVGPDYLINEYEIKTAQVESLFKFANKIMGEEFYNNYVKEYEHLMMRNAGTVNNKYFFGLEDDDMNLCTYKNESDEEDCVVRNLGNGEKRLGFYSNWKVEANKAFLVNEKFKPVKLTKIPDVNRDGLIDVNDVTATVDIILGKDSAVPYKFDHDAADVNNSNSIDVNDVTGIVDIVLGTKTIE